MKFEPARAARPADVRRDDELGTAPGILLQPGVPIYDVTRLLGDTIATVERVYGHHAPDYLGETIRRRTG